MTGRYPIRFGLMRAVIPPWRDFGMDLAETTLPELLAEAGYRHRAVSASGTSATPRCATTRYAAASPVRGPLQRRHRLLHARARRRARLAARLRVGRRAGLRHRPDRGTRGPLHRRPTPPTPSRSCCTCRSARSTRRSRPRSRPRPVRRPPRHRPAPRLAGGVGGRARAAGRPAHAEPARHRGHEPGPGRRHRPDSRPPRPPRRRGRHVRPVLLRQRRRGRGRRQPSVPGLEGDGLRRRHPGSGGGAMAGPAGSRADARSTRPSPTSTSSRRCWR